MFVAQVALAQAGAATLQVPAEYPTIAAAVAHAQAGDVVEVGPGTWAGFRTRTGGLTVRSSWGPLVTTLASPMDLVVVQSGGTLSLEGFALDPGAGSAVRVEAGATFVGENLRMWDVVGDADGALLQVDATGSATLAHSDVARVDLGTHAGLLQVEGDLTLDQVSFAAVTAADAPIAVVFATGTLLLTGTTLSSNSSSLGRGAIAVEGGSLTIRDGCRFVGNTAAAGGAVRASAGSRVDVQDAWFEDNVANDGGAIWSNAASLSVRATHFCDNRAAHKGGAVFDDALGAATASSWSRVVFEQNVAGDAGGALFLAHGSRVTVDQSDFLGNRAASGGAAALTARDAELTNTLVAGSSGVGVTNAGGNLAARFDLWWANTPSHLVGATLDATNVVDVDPELAGWTEDADCSNDDLTPATGSPLIDAGDPARSDPDGSRSDIGALAGTPEPPDTDILVETDVETDVVDTATTESDTGSTDSRAAPEDLDADGFVRTDDCDDTNPDVHPGAPDLTSDGIDQNCSGRDVVWSDGGGPACTCANADRGSGVVGLLALVLVGRRSRRRSPC